MPEQPPLTQTIFATGKLFELVHQTQPDGRVFEIARRAPGVRLIIDDAAAGKLLLTKEYRQELLDWDYRLPGGKVFDSLVEYETHRTAGADILDAARAKVTEEALQEAGIVVESAKLFKKSTLGATVEWDLYIFAASAWSYSAAGQQLEVGEQIQADNWFSYGAVKDMVLQGALQEERVALCLLQWLVKTGKTVA